MDAAGVIIKQAPIEKSGSIGVGERLHAPLRRAFNWVREDMDREVGHSECFSMAIFAVNATVGPEEIRLACLPYFLARVKKARPTTQKPDLFYPLGKIPNG